MEATIDIKLFFIILVLIALVILIVYGILVFRKLLTTLEHTNKVLEDVEVVSKIAASRSEDLDGIIGNVSDAASELSGAMSGSSFVSTVSSVAKTAASIRGLIHEDQDPEVRAAKKREKKQKRSNR